MTKDNYTPVNQVPVDHSPPSLNAVLGQSVSLHANLEISDELGFGIQADVAIDEPEDQIDGDVTGTNVVSRFAGRPCSPNDPVIKNLDASKNLSAEEGSPDPHGESEPVTGQSNTIMWQENVDYVVSDPMTLPAWASNKKLRLFVAYPVLLLWHLLTGAFATGVFINTFGRAASIDFSLQAKIILVLLASLVVGIRATTFIKGAATSFLAAREATPNGRKRAYGNLALAIFGGLLLLPMGCIALCELVDSYARGAFFNNVLPGAHLVKNHRTVCMVLASLFLAVSGLGFYCVLNAIERDRPMDAFSVPIGSAAHAVVMHGFGVPTENTTALLEGYEVIESVDNVATPTSSTVDVPERVLSNGHAAHWLQGNITGSLPISNNRTPALLMPSSIDGFQVL